MKESGTYIPFPKCRGERSTGKVPGILVLKRESQNKGYMFK